MGLDFNQNKLFGKGDEDAMQLSKRTIVNSVLFVIAFWAIVGALMCLLYRLTSHCLFLAQNCPYYFAKKTSNICSHQKQNTISSNDRIGLKGATPIYTAKDHRKNLVIL